MGRFLDGDVYNQYTTKYSRGVMLNEHTTMSLAMRPDIKQLINSLVRGGVISMELPSNLHEKTELKYGPSLPDLNKLKNCCHGAMYISIVDSMTMHLNPPPWHNVYNCEEKKPPAK